MMADLLAILILIIIACSGFFVAFTSSFGSGNSPASIAYALFQMFMGFTPAAWELWASYNMLGRAVLTLFLFICHFLVVTILITVMTNSFNAIWINANDEHQFVFAVNTISMVKSDALFSYIAPANIIGWVIAPLRFVLPFRSFIKLNRTVIKITHFPILFAIYFYERFILQSDPFHHAEFDGHRHGAPAGNWPEAHRTLRVREPSIATHRKDQALDEVFRRPLGRVQEDGEDTSHAINDWMRNVGAENVPPEQQDTDVVKELEQGYLWRRTPHRRRRYFSRNLRNLTETTRSVASDPEEYPARDFSRNMVSFEDAKHVQHTDDGDDELSTDEESDKGKNTARSRSSSGSAIRTKDTARTKSSSGSAIGTKRPGTGEDWGIPTASASRPSTAVLRPSRKNSPTRHHFRTSSSRTVLYNPDPHSGSDGNLPSPRGNLPIRSPQHLSGATTPTRRRPATSANPQGPAFPRPIDIPRPAPGLTAAVSLDGLDTRHPSIVLGSDIGDNKAVGGGFVGGGLPASFTTQFIHPGQRHGRSGLGLDTDAGTNPYSSHDSRDMLSKLVLARMKSLEESFQDLIQEVKDLRQTGPGTGIEVGRGRSAILRRKTDRDDGPVRNEPRKRKSLMLAAPQPTSRGSEFGGDGDVSDVGRGHDLGEEFRSSSF
jgi:hypothetical protein